MEEEIQKFIEQPKRIAMKYKNVICIVELNRTQTIKVLCLFESPTMLRFADHVDQMLDSDDMGTVTQILSYKKDGMGFLVIRKNKKTRYDDILHLLFVAMMGMYPICVNDISSDILSFYNQYCTLDRGFLFYDSNE